MYKEIKIDQPVVMESGAEYDLLILSQYEINDAIYVGLDSSKERLDYPADVTTNMQFLPPETLLIDTNNLYLKDYKEFIKTLVEYGIVDDVKPVEYRRSGFVEYPMYETGETANEFIEECYKEDEQ